MKVYLNTTHLPVLKRRLRDALPDASASIRAEAAARGLGFNTYAGLRHALEHEQVSATFDEPAFNAFLKERGTLTKARTLQRVAIRTVLEPIVEDNTHLTTHGFGVPNRYFAGEEYRAEMARSREEFFEDRYCDQFELALVLLQNAERRKSLNRKSTSYGLKHSAERVSRRFGMRTDLGDYVSNGVLIVAAIYEGFDVQQIEFGSLNAYLNISAKTVKLFGKKDEVRKLLGVQEAVAA